MLSVGQFKKTVRRTTEKSFEDLVAAAWLDRGIWSRHMSDKFSGVPDRYVAGGKWVEMKSLEYARGQVPYGAGLSIEQIRVCKDLIGAEEEVWYMALITSNTGQYVIWCPMHVVLDQEENMWDVEHEAKSGFGWCYKYDGRASVMANIPRDWL